MTAIAAANVNRVYSSGSTGKVVRAYYIKNVDTGDTVDLSADFVEIEGGAGISSGLGGTVAVGTTVGAVTLTLATMADDDVFILVQGNAA